MIRIPCPTCGEQEFADFLAGMRVKCLRCSAWLHLPNRSTPPVVVAPAVPPVIVTRPVATTPSAAPAGTSSSLVERLGAIITEASSAPLPESPPPAEAPLSPVIPHAPAIRVVSAPEAVDAPPTIPTPVAPPKPPEASERVEPKRVPVLSASNPDDPEMALKPTDPVRGSAPDAIDPPQAPPVAPPAPPKRRLRQERLLFIAVVSVVVGGLGAVIASASPIGCIAGAAVLVVGAYLLANRLSGDRTFLWERDAERRSFDGNLFLREASAPVHWLSKRFSRLVEKSSDQPRPPTASGPATILGAITIDRYWGTNPARSIPALCTMMIFVDRLVVSFACIASLILGTLLATHYFRFHGIGDDPEVGRLLLLITAPAYLVGFLFHRCIRIPNRYYVPLAIVYLPGIFFFYACLSMATLDALGFREDPMRRSAGMPGPQLTALWSMLIYLAMLAVASIVSIRSDMKSQDLPPGSVSFGFGVVMVLIGTGIGVTGFGMFVLSSAHSSQLTDFFVTSLVALVFLIPSYFLSQRAERLRESQPVTSAPGNSARPEKTSAVIHAAPRTSHPPRKPSTPVPPSPGLRTFWLGCVVLLVSTLIAVPFALNWMIAAEVQVQNDPLVREAEAIWHRHEKGGFEKYLDTRKKVGSRLSPSLSARVSIYKFTLGAAFVLLVLELTSCGFMIGKQDLRTNHRWFSASWYGIYAGLFGMLGCVIGAGLSKPSLDTAPEVLQAKALNKGEKNHQLADRRVRDAEDLVSKRSMPLHTFFLAIFYATVACTARAVLGASVCIYLLLYKLWERVQDGESRATPAQAIGYLFVPIYNLYWIFVAFPGLADELNRCAARRSLSVEPANRGLMVTYCILCYLVLVPFVGILAAFLNVGVGILALGSATRLALALDEQ